jgi:hypothetical protein
MAYGKKLSFWSTVGELGLFIGLGIVASWIGIWLLPGE